MFNLLILSIFCFVHSFGVSGSDVASLVSFASFLFLFFFACLFSVFGFCLFVHQNAYFHEFRDRWYQAPQLEFYKVADFTKKDRLKQVVFNETGMDAFLQNANKMKIQNNNQNIAAFTMVGHEAAIGPALKYMFGLPLFQGNPGFRLNVPEILDDGMYFSEVFNQGGQLTVIMFSIIDMSGGNLESIYHITANALSTMFGSSILGMSESIKGKLGSIIEFMTEGMAGLLVVS